MKKQLDKDINDENEIAPQKITGKIPTRVLPGFMELLPAEQIVFDRMKKTIQDVFELYGFVPIDTPIIERAEVLFAKAGGETEKQIYEFKKGDNDLALRFDLTVPTARYVSEYERNLVFPFKRYQIGKVYRGENPQKGRYREFYQCDIDIIGNGTLGLINDAEIPAVIYDVFSRLDIGPFVVRISNRKLLAGLMNSLDIGGLVPNVMRIIDKLEKVGEGKVKEMLAEIGVSSDVTENLFRFLSIKGTTEEVVAALRNLGIKDDMFNSGIYELENVALNLRRFSVPEQYFEIDLSIVRGLDYYTGTVYETKLARFPQFGSICSGGRYDNLTEKYSEKKFPGVGISIGLTRLFSQLKEVGLIRAETLTPTVALVVPLVSDMTVPFNIATTLRSRGISAEIYLEDAKIKSKLSYADKTGVPFVIIVGEDEIATGKFTIKDMKSGEQTRVVLGDLASYIYNR